MLYAMRSELLFGKWYIEKEGEKEIYFVLIMCNNWPEHTPDFNL